MTRSREDLPTPLGPMISSRSRGCTKKDRLANRTSPPGLRHVTPVVPTPGLGWKAYAVVTRWEAACTYNHTTIAVHGTSGADIHHSFPPPLTHTHTHTQGGNEGPKYWWYF
jgi:hypothetical protein